MHTDSKFWDSLDISSNNNPAGQNSGLEGWLAWFLGLPHQRQAIATAMIIVGAIFALNGALYITIRQEMTGAFGHYLALSSLGLLFACGGIEVSARDGRKPQQSWVGAPQAFSLVAGIVICYLAQSVVIQDFIEPRIASLNSAGMLCGVLFLAALFTKRLSRLL